MTQVGRLLADINGHIDRRSIRKGAHWTKEQHRAWKAANPDKVRANNERVRAKHRLVDGIRVAFLNYVRRRDPELAKDALAAAIRRAS